MMAEKTAGDGFWARNLCHYAKPFYPKCKEFLELSSGVDGPKRHKRDNDANDISEVKEIQLT